MPHNPLILIVDDEPQIRKFLSITLSTEDYRTEEAEDGAMAVRMASSLKPDLILLDLGLPKLDGQEVIQQLRAWTEVPIIVLSVREDEAEKVKALTNGADDYMTKPFGVEELLARIRTAFKHTVRQQSDTGETEITAGRVHINLMTRVVTVDEKELKLSPKEFSLLQYFAKHPNVVLTHRQILKEVWGDAHTGDQQYLRVYIGQLRNKIEKDPANPTLLLTEQGVGYTFKTKKS